MRTGTLRSILFQSHSENIHRPDAVPGSNVPRAPRVERWLAVALGAVALHSGEQQDSRHVDSASRAHEKTEVPTDGLTSTSMSEVQLGCHDGPSVGLSTLWAGPYEESGAPLSASPQSRAERYRRVYCWPGPYRGPSQLASIAVLAVCFCGPGLTRCDGRKMHSSEWPCGGGGDSAPRLRTWSAPLVGRVQPAPKAASVMLR